MKRIMCRAEELTHPALVWAGPWSALAVYSRKYSGTDSPKNSETPVMKRFLIEFMFVNCKKDSPTEAAMGKKINKQLYAHSSLLEREPHVGMFYHVLPTRPNKTQYMAAKIVNGIEAKSAPNFPVMCDKEIERVRAEWEGVYILLCFKTQKLT